jgi:hypothetical protein
MSTTAPEYLTTLRDGLADAMQQWMDQSTTAWDQWSQAWSPAVAAVGLAMPGGPGAAPGHRTKGGHRHGEKGCGCGDSAGGCREHGHHGGHHEAGHGEKHGNRDCGCGERHSHSRGCGCDDSCCRDACDCCVPEADVIVRARAGEVRVVPFRLHNPWRREREVSLEIGPWHFCSGDGDLEIRAVLEDDKLVLKPCEDRIVRLLISTRGASDDGSSSTRDSKDANDPAVPAQPADAAVKPAKPAGAAGRTPVDVVVGTTRRTTDVDSCVSAYADVRFEGCARPQRVAVVVLPAECDAVDIGCDCGCCC